MWMAIRMTLKRYEVYSGGTFDIYDSENFANTICNKLNELYGDKFKVREVDL